MFSQISEKLARIIAKTPEGELREDLKSLQHDMDTDPVVNLFYWVRKKRGRDFSVSFKGAIPEAVVTETLSDNTFMAVGRGYHPDAYRALRLASFKYEADMRNYNVGSRAPELMSDAEVVSEVMPYWAVTHGTFKVGDRRACFRLKYGLVAVCKREHVASWDNIPGGDGPWRDYWDVEAGGDA